MASKDNIAPQVAPADTASGVAPSGPHPAVSISTTSATMPPVVAHGFTGDVTTGTTASGVPPGVSVSNNSGAAQPGVPPSVPGGMTVGATPSGVPPGVSANSGAAQPGVPPSVPGGMTVGATPSGVPPGVSANSGAAQPGVPPSVPGGMTVGATPSGVPPSVPGGMTVGATPSGVPPSVSASNNSGAAQPGVPPSVPGGIAVGATPSGGPPVPATAPVVATPSRIPGGTTSAAPVLSPINLETAYVTNEIPFNNEGQFLRPNGEPELNDSDSGFDTDENAEDRIMKDVGNGNELKLGQRREKKFLKSIAKCDDPENLVSKLRALLREGERMSLLQLQGIVMPDRWAPEYQAQAHSAQKNIMRAISAGKSPDWEHQHSSGSPAEPLLTLHPFHKEAYEAATQYLYTIADVTIHNPERKDLTAQADAALRHINAQITELNQRNGLDKNTGIVDLQSIAALWNIIHNSKTPEAKSSGEKALSDFCRLRCYPKGWRVFPPRSKQSVPPQSVPPQSVPPQSVPPQSVPPQPTANGQFQPARGARKVIALAPRVIKRAIEPGKTSTGETICFIQRLGENRARFVVESSDKTRRLVESSDAGGFVAIEGATRAGMPETTRKETDILWLRSQVRSGGIYGLNFVAVGEWDPTQKRLPFIVAGFYYAPNDYVQATEYAISRSNLGKILSPREAERLIVEGIVGHQSMSLREALMSRLFAEPWQGQSPNQHEYVQMPYLPHQYGFNLQPDLQQHYFPQQLFPYVQQHAPNLQPVQHQPYFSQQMISPNSQQAVTRQAPQQQQYYQQQQFYQQQPPTQVSLGIHPTAQPRFHSYNSDGEEL